jgi:hypothetical protein
MYLSITFYYDLSAYRKFFTLLSFKGEFYTSGGYYSNKKTSEQAAALASLKLLNVDLPYELYNVNSSL